MKGNKKTWCLLPNRSCLWPSVFDLPDPPESFEINEDIVLPFGLYSEANSLLQLTKEGGGMCYLEGLQCCFSCKFEESLGVASCAGQGCEVKGECQGIQMPASQEECLL